MSEMIMQVRARAQTVLPGLGGEILGAAMLFALITGLFAAV